MKIKLTILTLLFFSSIFSQKNDEIKDFFWGKNDAYSKVIEIPEKYKNESAVIIYKNENYDYHKFAAKVTYTSSIRKRVKLLDQAAVTEFSEFSFKENFRANRGFSVYTVASTVNFGIKVIKPNGKEIEIDIDKEGVKTDDTKKIAIANLEVGDIVDYYFHIVEPFISVFEYGFNPVETTLGETYPVLNLKIRFETENDFFVNFNSYNGAPALEKVKGKKSSDRIYELNATDIAKNEFPRWFYPLVELPCYKFQVFFARSGKFEKRAEAFLPEKENIIKQVVTKEDVFNYYDSKFFPNGDLRDIEDFLKGKKFNSTEEKIKEIYYFTRHQFYTRYVEAFVADETKIIPYPYGLYGNSPIFFSTQEQFINYFMQYLKKAKIDYEIIVATGRENGPINDLLIQSNAKVLLKINTENPIYFGYFDPFSNPEQFDAELEKTTAYSLKVAKSKKVTDIEEIQLPGSTNQDNRSFTNVDIKLNDKFDEVAIVKNVELFGHNKEFEQKNLINFYDYVDEDYKKYGTTPLIELVKNKKKKEQYKKEFTALINKLKEKQAEQSKKEVEREYGTKLDNIKFDVLTTGRFGKDTPLSYKQEFTIKNDLVKKAGSNYIFEIGKLIDSQVDISEKERKRENNIYFTFPRKFEYNLVLSIPTGYSVSGLDKLNKNIENETGSFISSAEIKGDKLIIHATKKYNSYFEPAKNWTKITAFLDAAYQFTQEKILLKKN